MYYSISMDFWTTFKVKRRVLHNIAFFEAQWKYQDEYVYDLAPQYCLMLSL